MNHPDDLLARLDAIGHSLMLSEGARALLGMGSVGPSREFLDDYSDLDFFVVVDVGYKKRFVRDLRWLSRVEQIAYKFRNTADGYKLLFVDGIFCEFAIFDLNDIEQAAKPQARIIWADDQFDPLLARPVGLPEQESPTVQWLVGEALTNLYVGLSRFARGEKLSAMRFVQQYALDRVLALGGKVEFEIPINQDRFNNERRIEKRLPELADRLPRLAQGYDRTPQSAAEILFFLQDHFDVDAHIAREIRLLLKIIANQDDGP